MKTNNFNTYAVPNSQKVFWEKYFEKVFSSLQNSFKNYFETTNTNSISIFKKNTI